MIGKLIKKMRVSKAKKNAQDDFSRFFYAASSREKKKVLQEVVRKANEDQRTLMGRHANS